MVSRRARTSVLEVTSRALDSQLTLIGYLIQLVNERFVRVMFVLEKVEIVVVIEIQIVVGFIYVFLFRIVIDTNRQGLFIV